MSAAQWSIWATGWRHPLTYPAPSFANRDVPLPAIRDSLVAMAEEGWYRDPFKIHADRWISEGQPTALVRDEGIEAHDPPPEKAFTGHVVESEPSEDSVNVDPAGSSSYPAEGAYETVRDGLRPLSQPQL
jgi:hypothetical protein